FLRMNIAPPEEDALHLIEEAYIRGFSAETPNLQKAVKDAYRRLLQPALETEYRTALKQKADEDAIAVFAENLRQLLLSAPLGSKRML
ncbi:RNA-binding transcriptional accessory protein, partial [Acinetobacter baumannii]